MTELEQLYLQKGKLQTQLEIIQGQLQQVNQQLGRKLSEASNTESNPPIKLEAQAKSPDKK